MTQRRLYRLIPRPFPSAFVLSASKRAPVSPLFIQLTCSAATSASRRQVSATEVKHQLPPYAMAPLTAATFAHQLDVSIKQQAGDALAQLLDLSHGHVISLFQGLAPNDKYPENVSR